MEPLADKSKRELSGILERLLGETNGIVVAAQVASADGLVIVHVGMEQTRDQVAAGLTGQFSIAKGTGRQLNLGEVDYSFTKYQAGLLISRPVATGTILGIVTASEKNLSTVLYQAASVAERIGDLLAAAPRNAAAPGHQIAMP